VSLVRTFRPIKRRKLELTFDEEVRHSFELWLNKWSDDDYVKVRAIVHEMTRQNFRRRKQHRQ
jgi:hypothetical protein